MHVKYIVQNLRVLIAILITRFALHLVFYDVAICFKMTIRQRPPLHERTTDLATRYGPNLRFHFRCVYVVAGDMRIATRLDFAIVQNGDFSYP